MINKEQHYMCLRIFFISGTTIIFYVCMGHTTLALAHMGHATVFFGAARFLNPGDDDERILHTMIKVAWIPICTKSFKI